MVRWQQLTVWAMAQSLMITAQYSEQTTQHINAHHPYVAAHPFPAIGLLPVPVVQA